MSASALTQSLAVSAKARAPYKTRSRDLALASAIQSPEDGSIHEQVVDAMVYRAASELIRLDDDGVKTNIEAQGNVYDVLQSVEEGLIDVGASHFAKEHILETLKNYVSGLGADFARQAKAKPLYARVMVTNEEPKDIPDCKLSSVTCIDGARVQGDDAGRMAMTLTLYGTSNAMSQGMSMDRIFESGKKKWLLIYYGTIEGPDLNKFDTVDADLATLIQAVGAGGAASMEDIRSAIEKGTIAPEIMQLVAKIAELNRAVEASQTPGALENPEKAIAALKQAVAEISQTIPDIESLPQELVQAIAESMPALEVAAQDMKADVPVAASNDNETALEHTETVLEKLAALLDNDALPPEMNETLAALVQEIAKAVPQNDIGKIEIAILGAKEILIDFAASDDITPRMFHAISEILPAVVVAEKQIGEVLARPPVMAETELAALPPELAQAIADMKLLSGERIEILLQNEAIAPEVKKRLEEISRAIDTAIGEKDVGKLALAATEIRQTLTELSATETLPPQLAKTISEILPAAASSEKILAEIPARMQAEKILDAVLLTAETPVAAGQKAEAAPPELQKIILDLKEAVKQEGPQAAVEQIVQLLKAPAQDGAAHPVIEALVRQPELMKNLPPELATAVIAAIPATDTALRIELAATGIESPKAIAPEQIVAAFENMVAQVQSDAKADPAKAEIAKILTELKESVGQGEAQASADKIIDILKTPVADGGPHPAIEALLKSPEIIRALPPELKEIIIASVPAQDTNLRIQLAAAGIETPKAIEAQNFLESFDSLSRQIQAEAKTDPAKQEIAKALAALEDAIRHDDPQTASLKIIEAIKPAPDGAANPLNELIAQNPSIAKAMLANDGTAVVDAIAASRDVASRDSVAQPNAGGDALDSLVEQVRTEAKADPAKAETTKVLTEVREATAQGDPKAASDKVGVILQASAQDGVPQDSALKYQAGSSGIDAPKPAFNEPTSGIPSAAAGEIKLASEIKTETPKASQPDLTSPESGTVPPMQSRDAAPVAGAPQGEVPQDIGGSDPRHTDDAPAVPEKSAAASQSGPASAHTGEGEQEPGIYAAETALQVASKGKEESSGLKAAEGGSAAPQQAASDIAEGQPSRPAVATVTGKDEIGNKAQMPAETAPKEAVPKENLAAPGETSFVADTKITDAKTGMATEKSLADNGPKVEAGAAVEASSQHDKAGHAPKESGVARALVQSAAVGADTTQGKDVSDPHHETAGPPREKNPALTKGNEIPAAGSARAATDVIERNETLPAPPAKTGDKIRTTVLEAAGMKEPTVQSDQAVSENGKKNDGLDRRTAAPETHAGNPYSNNDSSGGAKTEARAPEATESATSVRGSAAEPVRQPIAGITSDITTNKNTSTQGVPAFETKASTADAKGGSATPSVDNSVAVTRTPATAADPSIPGKASVDTPEAQQRGQTIPTSVGNGITSRQDTSSSSGSSGTTTTLHENRNAALNQAGGGSLKAANTVYHRTNGSSSLAGEQGQGAPAQPPKTQTTDITFSVSDQRGLNSVIDKWKASAPELKNLDARSIPQQQLQNIVEKLPREERTAFQNAINKTIVMNDLPAAKPPAAPQQTNVNDVKLNQPQNAGNGVVTAQPDKKPEPEFKKAPDPVKVEPPAEADCKTTCDGSKGCCPQFNNAATPEQIAKTAAPLMDGFANFGMDNLANNSPAQPRNDSFDSALPAHQPEKRLEPELKDFMEPKGQKPEAEDCRKTCDGKKGCCPVFEVAASGDANKTAAPLMSEFANFGLEPEPQSNRVLTPA